MITAKLDVTKIDKTKLFKGVKGTYLDIVLIDTPEGKYGDYMVVQSVSKEDREAGKRGAILGNGKTTGKKQDSTPAPQKPPQPAKQQENLDEDVPF